MKNYQRLFVASPLPDLLVEELETYTGIYDQPGIRLVPSENWHLTLHFIGNVPPTKVPEIVQILQNVASNFETFTLKLLRVAPGPNKNSPRLIWAQFAENAAFEKLNRAITIGLGEKMQNQHPIPHITLARFAKDFKPAKLMPTAARSNTPFQVSQIALYESELGKSHPRYTILEKFSLQDTVQ